MAFRESAQGMAGKAEWESVGQSKIGSNWVGLDWNGMESELPALNSYIHTYIHTHNLIIHGV